MKEYLKSLAKILFTILLSSTVFSIAASIVLIILFATLQFMRVQ